MPKTKSRTKEEIQRQIDGLKKDKEKLPEYSMFGDNNWERIGNQISVLEGKLDPDSLYVDEGNEDYEDGDNDLYFSAQEANDWLCGSTDEDLFDED
jgi:hypothetical protein